MNFESRYATFEAEDVLGSPQEVECVYGWPLPVTDQPEDLSKKMKDTALLAKVVEFVRENEGLNRTEVRNGVKGNKSKVIQAIERAEADGVIKTKSGPSGSKLHFYNETTPL